MYAARPFVFGHRLESQAGVVRSVPRNFLEGGQGHSLKAAGRRPVGCFVDEFSAETLPRKKRVDGHLLDMSELLDYVNQYVSHRLVTGIGGDPCPVVLLIGGQCFQAGWRIISDGFHPEGSECFAGGDFNVAHLREVFCNAVQHDDHL